MRFLFILSVLFFTGCHYHHKSILKKTQTFTNYFNEQGKKMAYNPTYSHKNLAQNLKKKHTTLFSNKKLDFSKYTNNTLKELWKVYYIMSSQSLEKKYFLQFKNIFKEIKKRNLDKEKCVMDICAEEFFNVHIKFGNLLEVKQLKEDYPDILKQEPVPNVYESNSILQKPYKLYDVSADGKSIKLISVKMENGPKIVALLSPTCHFAKLAMNDILSEPDLKNIFKNHALIIFPLNISVSPIVEIANWNKDNPELKYFIYSNREDLKEDWGDFDFTGTPKFYFLKDKKIIHQFGGWGPTEKEFKLDLRKAIKQIGLPTTY